MPYNPSSAYPRHSTYTPPVYGRGFARGFNEVDWGQRFGHAVQGPSVDASHPISRVANAPSNQSAGAVLDAMNRRGMLTAAGNAMVERSKRDRKTQQARKAWNRAEYGDDPNEIGPPGTSSVLPPGPGTSTTGPREIDTRTPEGRAEAAKLFPGGSGLVIPPPRSGGSGRERPSMFPSAVPTPQTVGDTGGRPHVGGTNDRLGAIAQRVTTSSAMNDVANRVLSGGIGGPMKVPKFVIGAARSVNRRRKGA